MENIHQILNAIQNTSNSHVLATIIHVEGTAYLKEGTTMLFQDDGTQIGMLSAGCLESDLSIRVKDVFIDGNPRTMLYDMSDETDISWGQGTGCNGNLYITIELVDQKLKANLLTLKKCLEEGVPVQHIKTLTKDLELISNFFYSSYINRFRDWHVDLPAAIMQVKKRNQSGVYKSNHFPLPIYTHLFLPKPRLVIFGAGPDVKPLVDFAAQTGYSVTVCDSNVEICNKYHFPNGSQFLTETPKKAIEQLNLTSHDFIIIMTHHFQKDQEILSSLIHKNLRYLGILGPRYRTGKLLGHANIPSHLHSPIGLSIGANGPHEIAISILAELIQCLNHPSPNPEVSR
ncbi:XdhC family protein [Chengkuizengella axinellae]|uniref:XdhC family protein n=1 Tax=Chengkuizengella axinellae TaxID=3064388 RepID=A0ABT9J462_9BACL|nr:XdhC/CoxI family protein [Chengkuizengella sp. 2205SS18-9]MDP5276242.1 XdhC family protein [Chengkuizengella sp. 2205SS18-9]